MACLLLLATFQVALNTIVAPSTALRLLGTMQMHMTKQQICVVKRDHNGPSKPNTRFLTDRGRHPSKKRKLMETNTFDA